MKYLFITFIAAGLLVACNPKTAEIMDAVDETETATTTGDMPLADIGEGKVVFLENCITCHYGRSTNNVPGLVDSYSKAEWDKILPKMIKEAELDTDKSRQVSAYIYWEIEN